VLDERKWFGVKGSKIKCGHPLPALTDIGPAVAASKHTTVPINHTRPSPRKHSSGGTNSTEIADTRLL